MHALHSFLLISDMLLVIFDKEGFSHILSHFLHLKRKLLLSCSVTSHSDLLISPLMHALHSPLLVSDKLSTRFDNEVTYFSIFFPM